MLINIIKNPRNYFEFLSTGILKEVEVICINAAELYTRMFKNFQNLNIQIFFGFYLTVNYFVYTCLQYFVIMGELAQNTAAYLLVASLFIWAALYFQPKLDKKYGLAPGVVRNKFKLNNTVIQLCYLGCLFIVSLMFQPYIENFFVNANWYNTYISWETFGIDFVKKASISFIFVLFLLIFSSYSAKYKNLSFKESLWAVFFGIICANALISSMDLIEIFLLVEFFAFLTIYLIVVPKTNKILSGLIVYFVINVVYAAIFLFSIWLLFIATQQLDLQNISEMNAWYTGATVIQKSSLGIARFSSFRLIFLFCFVGSLMIKLMAFPVYTVAEKVYTSIPFSALAFILVVVKTGIFVLFLRAYNLFTFIAKAEWFFILLFFSVGCSVAGCAGAWKNTKVKGFLAYSSISQAGYFLLLLIYPSGESSAMTFCYVYCYVLTLIYLLNGIVKADVNSHFPRLVSAGNPRALRLLESGIWFLMGFPPSALFFMKLNILLQFTAEPIFLVYFGVLTMLTTFYSVYAILMISYSYAGRRLVLTHERKKNVNYSGWDLFLLLVVISPLCTGFGWVLKGAFVF